MAYVAGLYTRASEASAAEAARFRQFQNDIDAMSQRERDAIMRQQQAAMDRNMAGLISPGSAPDFAGAVTGPKPEQFPKGTALPPLEAPEALPAAPKPGLSAYPATGTPGYTASGIGGSPVLDKDGRITLDKNGNVVTTGAGGQQPWTQETFRALPAAEQQKIFEAERQKRRKWVSGPMGVGGFAQSTLTMDEFVKEMPTRDKVMSEQTVDQTGKGDFTPNAPAPAAGLDTSGAQTAPLPAPPGSEETLAAPSRKLQSHLGRAAKIPSVVGSKQGQALIRRATELGVDPAAAIALSGIETDFGANVKDSVQGAQGILQVMPDTFRGMKTWFSDPANIEQYNIPEALVIAAQNMQPGSMDAGLLRLKYNELVGVPKNLWGAAFQSNAEQVRDAGSPLAISDGNGFSNADYNTAYVALYNEARNYVNIATEVPASPATNATFNLERLDREQQLYQTTYTTTLTAMKTQYDQVAAQRQRLVQQMQFAQQSGFASKLPELQRQLDQLDTAIIGINGKANELNIAYQTGVEDFNLKRINEFANVALFRMESGDPAALNEMWSRATGQDIQLQRSGDLYNIYVNGTLTETGVSAGDVRGMFMNEFSQEYAARQAELSEKIAEEKYKAEKEIAIEQLKQIGALTLEKLKQAKPEWGDLKEMKDSEGNTSGFVGIEKSTGRIIRMRIKPGMMTPGGILTAEDFEISIRDAGLTGSAQ